MTEGPVTAEAATADKAQTGLSKILERGEITEGGYRNRFFGLHLPLPQGWVALPDDELVWPPVSGLIKQIRAGVPLGSLPAIPLFVMVDGGEPPAGAKAAATIIGLAMPIPPEELKLPLKEHADSLRRLRERGMPGERFTVEFEQLAGKPSAVIDGKAPNGMRQRQWFVTSRGYFIAIAGNYENRQELDQIRAAFKTLTWMFEAR